MINLTDIRRILPAGLLAAVILLAVGLVACGAPGSASLEPAAGPPAAAGGLQLDLVPFASGLDSPVSLANAGDDRLFAVEQDGRIRIVEADGTVLPTPFLDITGRVDSDGNEKGLLGLVFHPAYTSNGYFYVNYTHTTPGGQLITRISRFSVTADPDVADPDSEEILLTVDQPFSNHNAGDIHFGPDGYLYIPLGDGGSGGDPQNNAQQLFNLLGKVNRIDVDSSGGTAPDCAGDGTGNYTVPADNPFVGEPGDVCDEIWALGLRNPWRSSFDRQTGDYWIGDVGQFDWEEIDFQPAGSAGAENYGWSCYEGNHFYDQKRCDDTITYTFPIFEYNHDPGSHCAVVGGFVYRGSQFPAMAGHYFLTDYCSGYVWDIVPDGQGGWTVTLHTNMQQFGYTSFGEAVDGELYVAQRSGTIYHLVEEGGPTPTPTATGGPTDTPTATATATSTATATTTATPGPPLEPNQLYPIILNDDDES